jgi:hypothetical protein
MSDETAALHQQSVVEACRDANERDRRETGDLYAELSDCERAVLELGDLRAALAVTLKLLRWHSGPNGSRVLTGPSDREVMRAIRHLQQAADDAHTGVPPSDRSP